jgi:hypothetical protein
MERWGVRFGDALRYLADVYSVPLDSPMTAADRLAWAAADRAAELEADQFTRWLEGLTAALRTTRDTYWQRRITALRWADRHMHKLEDPAEWRWDVALEAVYLGDTGDHLNTALNRIEAAPIETLTRLWRERRAV